MPRPEADLDLKTDAAGRLSAQLRQSRKAAGLALRSAADAAGCSPGHLSHLEHGRHLPSEPLVVTLDVLYRAHGLLLSLYEELLGERRRRNYDEALRLRGESPKLIPEASGQTRWIPPTDALLPLDGDASTFIGDGMSPIGVLLQRGTRFQKSWVIVNSGSHVWRDRFLQRVGPNAAASLVSTDRAVPIPETAPGNSAVVVVHGRSQWIESTSVAHFKMVFADGRLCWPDRYSHGLDLLVTSTVGKSCECTSCHANGPLETLHRESEDFS